MTTLMRWPLPPPFSAMPSTVFFPRRAKREFGEELFWVRARLEMGSYARAPRIEDILPNTVPCVNALTVATVDGCSRLRAAQR